MYEKLRAHFLVFVRHILADMTYFIKIEKWIWGHSVDEDLCKEAVYSNDYYDLILDYIGGYPLGDPECILQVDDTYDIGFYSRARAPELNLQDYPYLTIPHCLTPMDMTALEVSGILRLQNPAALDLQGQGVLIGFVDTGINYEHPAFRNADGNTRIMGIWDQTRMDGTPPSGMVYGAFYGEAEINAALQAEHPEELVPERDENGHGTFLAGVACGSADAGAGFSGAAPLAHLAVVKCKQAKQYLRDYYFIPDGVECYQENDVMMGLTWLNDLAYELRLPLVLCIGMGGSLGNHAGEEPLSVQCDELGRRRQRAVVVAAGNEANQRHHEQRSVIQGEAETIEVSVGERVNGFQMEVWTMVPEVYQVSVISPTGERFPKTVVRPGSRQEYTFLFEQTRLTVEYTIVGTRNSMQLICLRFEKPFAGIWSVEMQADLALSGNVFCWLPLSAFLSGEVFFLRSSPDTTITMPGMSRVAITAGAYQAVGGSIYPDSGRGFSSLGAVKPDLIAPGVNVSGPTLRDRYELRSGTSISAALTAGACAQMFQWGIVENNMLYLNTTELKSLLIRGAGRDEDRTYPSPVYGYGTLNVYDALLRLRGI